MSNNYTMSALKVNLWAIPLMIAQVIIFSLSFYIYLGKDYWLAGLRSPLFYLQYFLPLLFIAGFLHELLHAGGFYYFGKVKRSDLKLGIIWKYLTPYAHCKVAVSVRAYRIALLLPYMILGIIPVILSFLFRFVWLNVFGLVFCLVAGGDLLVFWLIRKVPASELLKDHPSLCGCESVDIAKN